MPILLTEAAKQTGYSYQQLHRWSTRGRACKLFGREVNVAIRSARDDRGRVYLSSDGLDMFFAATGLPPTAPVERKRATGYRKESAHTTREECRIG
jgi:hypothetical protein